MNVYTFYFLKIEKKIKTASQGRSVYNKMNMCSVGSDISKYQLQLSEELSSIPIHRVFHVITADTSRPRVQVLKYISCSKTMIWKKRPYIILNFLVEGR